MVPVLFAVAVRPWLWAVAVRQLLRCVPRGWWRHAPFLPVPDRAYVEFRVVTAYGATGRPTARDVTDYLEWCRR